MARFATVLLPLLFAVLVSVEGQVTGLSGWNIYLDPGHSQTENQGVYGYSEAEKNLQVALELRRLLLQTTDIDTVYISRTNDTQNVSLSQRSDDANTIGAAWFHSIHSDAGAPELNSTLLLWGQLLNGAEKTPAGGQAMSSIMVDLLTRAMRTSSRGSRGDCGFYGSFIADACSGGGPYLSVNRRTTMPSELSESGFHTSPVQNVRNMNSDWKRLEARAMYWTILKYHGIDRPLERQVTGFVRDIETGELLNGALVSLDDSTYQTDTFASLFNQYSSDPDELKNGFFYFDEGVAENPDLHVVADGYSVYDTTIAAVDSFFTFHDIELIPSTPPAVIGTFPNPDGTQRVIDDIVLDFNRIMDRTSVEAAFEIVPDVSGNLIWSNDDFRLIFRPDSFFLPMTEFTLTIGESARGLFGDGLDGDGDGAPGGEFSLAFETGPADVSAPLALFSYPAINERDIDRQPVISVVYDEPLDTSSIGDDLFLLEPTLGSTSVPGRYEYYEVDEKGILTFFPEEILDPEVFYRLSIFGGLTDIFGNVQTSTKTVTFRTTSDVVNYESLDTFDNDLASWWVPQQSGTTTGIVTDSTRRTPDNEVVNLLTGSTSSMRIDYGWNTSSPSWLIRTYLSTGPPRSVVFDSTYTVQVYVFGDGSGNLFRFAVDDNYPVSAASNHEVSPWYVIDWYGWQPVSWRPARDGVGQWLGDGVVDGNTIIDSIQLSHVSGASEYGSLYFDDLRIAAANTTTGTHSDQNSPTSILLHQNYPNPFRGTTRFIIDVPDAGRTLLRIYNMLGEEIARPFDNPVTAPGRYEIAWDASFAASGVYLARLENNNAQSTIQLVVLK